MYFGANEIMERKNLLLITDRLMCRKMNGIPVISMSRKAISERGVQVQALHSISRLSCIIFNTFLLFSIKRFLFCLRFLLFVFFGLPSSQFLLPQVARNGILVPGGGRMVVTVFWSNDEVVFQTYDPRNSQPMRTSVTMVFLKVWLTDEQVGISSRRVAGVNHQRVEFVLAILYSCSF